VVTAFGAIAGVAVQLGVVGGGSSNSASPKQASLVPGQQAEGRSQPQADWARKANVICTKTIKTYRQLPRESTFTVLKKQLDTGWLKVARIRDLAPPQGETKNYAKFVSAIAGQMEALDERYQLLRQTKTADAGFVKAHNALLARIHDLNRRADTLAVELGATVCAQEPY
jgi:hypothetical protein